MPSLRPSRIPQAFSLLELLVVVAILSILAVAGATGLGSFSKNGDLNRAVAETGGTFENARQYAVTYNTHVYVGFAEVLQGGVKRLMIASFTAPDGVKPTGSSITVDGENLVSLSRPRTFANVELGSSTATGQASLEGSIPSIVLRVNGADVNFSHVVGFTPSGEARVSAGKVPEIGFLLQDARRANPMSYGFSVSGITGMLKVGPM